MFDQSVGSVLVTDNGSLKGIVTDRDLVIELLTGNGVANVFEDSTGVADLTAQDVMTANPVTVDSEMEFPNVLIQMADAKARRIQLPKMAKSPESSR